MLLHTVSKSPDSSDALASCLRAALPGACILLLEDGVYAARAAAAVAQALQSSGCMLYVLREDLEARGLDTKTLAGAFEIVDYAGFVQLSADCHAVQSWY